MSSANDSIFDVLIKLSECQYISDLPHFADRDALASAVEQVGCDDYSVDEWNELTGYISGERCDFASSERAKKALIELLRCGDARD